MMGAISDDWMDEHVFGLRANKADQRRARETPEQRKARKQRERERTKASKEHALPPAPKAE